jgi:putative peptide zinc metalloprotease protein
MRRFAALVVALLLLTSGTAYAQDNTAVVVNTKDGSSLFKFSFNIARVMQDTVDNANAAVAVASCTDCQTTALAIQFVLVMGEPDVFIPQNLALAMNIECTLCDTLASAYQFVIQVDGPVRITPEGKRRLHELRKELAALEDSGLSSFELQARIDSLAEEAYEVMSTSLVPVGPPAEAPADAGTTTSTTEAPTTTTTDAPTTTTTDSPTTTTTTSTP